MTCEQLEHMRLVFNVVSLLLSTVALVISVRVWFHARSLVRQARQLSQEGSALDKRGAEVIRVLRGDKLDG